MLYLLLSLRALAAPEPDPGFFKPGLAIEAVVIKTKGALHKRLGVVATVAPADAALALRGACADAETFAQPMLLVEDSQRAQVTIRNDEGYVSLEVIPTIQGEQIELRAALDVASGRWRMHAGPTMSAREGKWVVAQDETTTLALRVHHVDTPADLHAVHAARELTEARFVAELEPLGKGARKKAILNLLQ